MKISEIKEELLTDAQRTAFLFPGFAYTGEKAETAILLGTNRGADVRAKGAADLYLAGGVRKIIPSGKPLWDFPEGHFSEAAYMKYVGVSCGVDSAYLLYAAVRCGAGRGIPQFSGFPRFPHPVHERRCEKFSCFRPGQPLPKCCEFKGKGQAAGAVNLEGKNVGE